MQLVGEMQLRGAAWDLDSFGRLFERLKNDVEHTGDLTRYVGYESITGDQVDVRFLGIEVDRIGPIPEGTVSWDLRGSEWTVLEPKEGQTSVTWRENLAWQWFDRSAIGRAAGEFAARCPADWTSPGGAATLEFRMTANAYVAPAKGGFDDDVCLVGYDPEWPRRFEEIARWIQNELGPLALRVEHYGSTAIPGMPAKPVIDVLVEVPSFAEARRRAIPVFNNPRWEYWAYSNHLVFVGREELMGRRTHHIHMAPAEHEIWRGLAFRDYLRSNGEEALRYAALKRELAECHRTDRERYTRAKAAYVTQVTPKALQVDASGGSSIESGKCR